MIGTVQARYIVEALDLENSPGPFNIEMTTGDPADSNVRYFYDGAMDVLKPYIDEGKLNVMSDQWTIEEVCTPAWSTDEAEHRAADIIKTYYKNADIDAWLCSNDSTALGVENALAENYAGSYPVITGQDCDILNVKNIISGRQSMSVFKDTRILASQAVKMAGQIIRGIDVDVNDTITYNNGVKTVPSFLCECVWADADNYKDLLIDSGYYTEDMLIR
jgi:putative multiple sugar transport system substrate-binding protein